MRHSVVHTLPHPRSAVVFVGPVVARLNDDGWRAMLWHERDNLERRVRFDLPANPLRFAVRVLRFAHALLVAKPDVLHAHQTKGALIPMLAAALVRVPVRIYHNHGMPFLGYRGILRVALRWLEIVNITTSTVALSVSLDNVDRARAECSPMKRVTVLGKGSACGCDATMFESARSSRARQSFRRRHGISESTCVLLYVGRAYRRKGFHDLLAAWKLVAARELGAVLLLAGISPNDLVRIGAEVEQVVALGFVENMIELYTAADIVALPSHHEGLPYALLEGAFAGCAMLGTDVPGITPMIREGETGFLSKSGDTTSFARHITTLAANKALRVRLGNNARIMAYEQYERQTVLRHYSAFYKSVESRLVVFNGRVI